MPDDDLRYQHETRPLRAEPVRSQAIPALLIVLVLAAAGAATWYFWPKAKREPAAAPAPTGAETPPTAASTPASGPAPAGPPPPLDGSDEPVRARLRALSSAPEWDRWLTTDDLVRRWVSGVARIGEGKSPLAAFDHLRLEGSFAVRASGGRSTIDPASYARYDRTVAVLETIDLEALRSAWSWLRPVAESAWREIAPPDSSLEAGLLRAIDHLLATPQPPAEIEVRLEDGLYRYADPALEALTPAQKHLLRTGSDNAARLRKLLGSLRAILLAPD